MILLLHWKKNRNVHIYDRFGIPIRWQDGDVAVVCNMRFAHGRPGVHLLPGEKRELGVMLGPLLELSWMHFVHSY